MAVTQVFAPSPDGPIRCEVFRPEGAPSNLPTMMYFHGGSFMVGRSEDTEFLTRKMSVQNNLVVVSVNYRLAPEWPFSTGLDDCVAAYRWVLEQGETLGADTGRIGFAVDRRQAHLPDLGSFAHVDTTEDRLRRSVPKTEGLDGYLVSARERLVIEARDGLEDVQGQGSSKGTNATNATRRHFLTWIVPWCTLIHTTWRAG